MKTSAFRPRTALTAIAFGFAASLAAAQAWPAKPITLIVPFPPGGSSDALARAITTPLSQSLGQPVVVESKPGAGATVGADYVAKAKADGYTLLMGAVHHTIATSVYKKLLLWLLDPANRPIVDANAASTALLFQHLLMPADCSNQFQHVGASSDPCGRQYSQTLLVDRTDGCRRQEPVPFPIRRLDLQRIEEYASAAVRSASGFDRSWLDRQGRDCRGRRACEPAKSFE
ncbi:tripartite tricarboxylate transporter substrate-binding protein [Variovorax sp. LjRoot290]